MNITNIFRNSTVEDLRHDRSGSVFPAGDPIELYGEALSEMADTQMISWLNQGFIVYNDGSIDYTPSEAIATLTQDGFSYSNVNTTITIPVNRQMITSQRLTVAENGRLVIRGELRVL